MSRWDYPRAVRPRLAFDLTITQPSDSVALERGEDIFEVSGLEPAAVRAALDEMRGDRPLSAIAAVSGIDVPQLQALCAQLAGAGLLWFDAPDRDVASAAEMVAPAQLVEACNDYFTAWKTRLFSGALWTCLSTGEAPRPLFLGWLIENYFFIEAATARMPMAIAGARDPAVRRLFAKHFSEEYDHYHFFQRALAEAGIEMAALETRSPLPSTQAIRNHMRDCGRRDPLAYAACSGFLESTGEDHIRAHAFFDRLSRNFEGEASPIIAPLAEHARLDEGYQHCGMLRLVAEAIGPVTLARAEAALEAARLLVETLEVWSTDILRHYGDAQGLQGGVRRYRPLEYETSHV